MPHPMAKKLLIVAVVGLAGIEVASAANFFRAGGFLGLTYGDESFLIESLETGFPAEEAGLLVGDVVTAIDGVDPELANTGQKGAAQRFSVDRDGQPIEVSVTRAGYSNKYLAGAIIPGVLLLTMSAVGLTAFLRGGSRLTLFVALGWLVFGFASIPIPLLPRGLVSVWAGTLFPLTAVLFVHFLVGFGDRPERSARAWVLLPNALGLVIVALGLTAFLQSAVPILFLALAAIAGVSLIGYWRSTSSQPRRSSGLYLLLACPLVFLAATGVATLRPWGQYVGMPLLVAVPWLTAQAALRREQVLERMAPC